MCSLVFGMSADQVDLGSISHLVSEYGDANGWDPLTVMKVNLLVEELVLNVRDHGEVAGRRFEVEIRSGDSRVRLYFWDDGVPFDPVLEAPLPDLCASVEERRLGGLGVHLVRSLADSVDYRYEAGWNMLSVALRV